MTRANRFLACFGNGFVGRLGTGAECISEVFPRVLGTLIGYSVKQVACGGAHTVAVSDDGAVFSFGQNDKGQLGHSRNDKFIPVPIEVGIPDEIRTVAAGEHHTLCLSDSGDVWSFGSNDAGQLGLGERVVEDKHAEPRMVRALKGAKIVGIAAGSSHSLALTSAGELLSWGQSDFGALGHGPELVRQVRWEPSLVRALARVKVRSVTAGYYSSGCISDFGHAYTWGNGLYWQLGHGDAAHEYVPRQVEELRVCGSLSLGQMHGMGTGFDGALYAWGTDDHGTLGQGEGAANWQRQPIKRPKVVPGMRGVDVKAAVCGWKHSMAVSTGGSLYSWGWNGSYHTDISPAAGQLGQGDDRDRWAPAQVMRLRTNPQKFYDLRMPFVKPWKVVQAAAGRNHSAMVVEGEIDARDLA